MMTEAGVRDKAGWKIRSVFREVPRGLRLTGLFGAFVFLQFTALGLANHAGEGYLTPEQRELVYYALQVFVILGYLLNAWLDRICIGRARRWATSGMLGLLFLCGSLIMVIGTASGLSVIVSMALALSLGMTGGVVHLRMSMEMVTWAKPARCMGLGSAAAVLLQYLLQIRRSGLLPLFMLAAFFILASQLMQPLPETTFVEIGKREKTSRRHLLFSILIAFTFILFTCFFNETIHHLMIRSQYTAANVYSWPRLMMIPGYLLFAGIGDRENGRAVPVMSLCIMLMALLNVVLVGTAGTYELNMCLFYLAIAAFTSYYLLTFWRLAPGTGNPALWAPFGRMLDSGAVLLAGMVRLSTFPAPAVLGAELVGVAMVILLMAFRGDFNFSPGTPPNTSEKPGERGVPTLSAVDAPAETVPQRPLSPTETLARMQQRYHLTPRETDVLRELVLTEDKQAVISERLSIRVKTLQDYVTRLYRKTGTSTRLGLGVLYEKNRNQD